MDNLGIWRAEIQQVKLAFRFINEHNMLSLPPFFNVILKEGKKTVLYEAGGGAIIGCPKR
jgi:hypothetical protein